MVPSAPSCCRAAGVLAAHYCFGEVSQALRVAARTMTLTMRPEHEKCPRVSGGAPASPDGDSLLGGQPHRVVFGDVEGVIEGVDVANDLVTAELGG